MTELLFAIQEQLIRYRNVCHHREKSQWIRDKISDASLFILGLSVKQWRICQTLHNLLPYQHNMSLQHIVNQ